jgi:hypothetical protein
MPFTQVKKLVIVLLKIGYYIACNLTREIEIIWILQCV